MNASGPLLALAVVGWSLLTLLVVAAAVAAVLARRSRRTAVTSTAVGLTVLALIVAALPPGRRTRRVRDGDHASARW